MKQTARHLIDTFFDELRYGIKSPATFEELYNDDEECLKLKVWFYESGDAPPPDSEPYLLEVKRFEFYTLTEKAEWKYVNPDVLGISKNDFN